MQKLIPHCKDLTPFRARPLSENRRQRDTFTNLKTQLASNLTEPKTLKVHLFPWWCVHIKWTIPPAWSPLTCSFSVISRWGQEPNPAPLDKHLASGQSLINNGWLEFGVLTPPLELSKKKKKVPLQGFKSESYVFFHFGFLKVNRQPPLDQPLPSPLSKLSKEVFKKAHD